jgi:hypothetical protein
MKNAKIFLNTYYNCQLSTNAKRTSQHINCKHWSVDSNTCKTTCALNVFENPEPTQCLKCDKREAIVGITVKQTEQINSPSVAEKTINYTKAEISQMFSGKVSEEIFQKRKDICLSCEYRVNPNPELESIGWCKGGCGCVVGNPRAGLSQKLYMPSVSCPKKKWGIEKGDGFKVADTLDSIKGVATSVKNLFEKDK